MLTVRDQATLNIAARTYKHPGARTDAIRHELGMSEARYAQVLNALLDNPDAEATYPALVRRLRRLREARRLLRAG